MSTKIQLLICFVAIAAALQTGISTALHINIQPDTFNEVVTDELIITCRLNGSVPMLKQVIMLEIWKKDKSPLAIIRQDEITSGPGLKSNMKAMGYIDKHGNNSHLRLTIKNPVIEDAGSYSCVLFYLNNLYQLIETKVNDHASVTVDTSDITQVVTYLMGKVSVLEKTTQEQGKVISKQKETIEVQDAALKKQENQLKTQEQQLRQQQDLVKQLVSADKVHETAVSLMQDKLEKHDVNIEEQEIKLKQQNESMNLYRRNMDDIQQEQSMELENYMVEQRANATYVSAFSYQYHNSDTYSNGATLLFRTPILNIGDDYDPKTGVFTAPRKGLYSFHLFTMTYTNNWYVHIDLKTNDATVATLYSRDNYGSDQSAISSVVSLNAGEKVWPVTRSINGGYLYNGLYSVFTGYLLRLL